MNPLSIHGHLGSVTGHAPAMPRRRVGLLWLALAWIAGCGLVLPAAEVRRIQRAVRAKALEALAVGNLAPGRELDTWKFSSLARNFFGGGWW